MNKDLDKVISDLNYAINEDLKKIVFLEGDWGYVYMKYLGTWSISAGLIPCPDNFRLLLLEESL